MATAGQRDDRAEGPAGWMMLLGLMVLALVIAWSAKGCGSSDPNTSAAPSVTTTSTSTGSTSANAGQNVVTEINTTITKSGGIQFQTASAELTNASMGTLDDVARILSRNATVNVLIKGHTDTQGNADTNLSLSQRRANKVKDYLISKGIASSRMKAQGFGENEPLVPNDTTSEAARKQNRRVEFQLMS
jgi:outer membrane protein OmpA-like peptidoglycan-associated protein